RPANLRKELGRLAPGCLLRRQGRRRPGGKVSLDRTRSSPFSPRSASTQTAGPLVRLGLGRSAGPCLDDASGHAYAGGKTIPPGIAAEPHAIVDRGTSVLAGSPGRPIPRCAGGSRGDE